jgi:hypothetical protein
METDLLAELNRVNNEAIDPEETSKNSLVELSYCPNEIKNVRVIDGPCKMDPMDELNIEMRTVSDPNEIMGTVEKLCYTTQPLRCECILI